MSKIINSYLVWMLSSTCMSLLNDILYKYQIFNKKQTKFWAVFWPSLSNNETSFLFTSLQVAEFWKEARILGQLHHPNIVAFYGVVTDGPVTNLATVTEYMVNGSLKQVLQKKDRYDTFLSFVFSLARKLFSFALFLWVDRRTYSYLNIVHICCSSCMLFPKEAFILTLLQKTHIHRTEAMPPWKSLNDHSYYC